jgi:hypothetical protein
MNSILGTYREGHIVPDGPVDWPEGARVVRRPEKLLSEQLSKPLESGWA